MPGFRLASRHIRQTIETTGQMRKENMNKPKLTDFGMNVYSQFGEDGIIAEIFKVIERKSGVCVEVGAWDGMYLSNTKNLWTHGWKGILIEGDKEKYEKLVENVKLYDCLALHYYVGRDPQRDSLDYILHANGVTDNIDFLSIDVDGNDYYIFESLEETKPRVVICEINPTIPYYLDIYADYDNYFGCSIAALNRVARTKGYVLVACTKVNCLYVREEEYHLLEKYETGLHEIVNKDGLNYIITNYAGDYAVIGTTWYGLKNSLDLHVKTGPGVDIDKTISITRED